MAENEQTPQNAERNQFLAVVQSAMKKHAAKIPLTKAEARAWSRWEYEEDERRGMRFLKSLPKKLYCQIVGRQPKVLNDQADAYGFPLRGATVDVFDVLKSLHDFLAKYKHELPAIVRGEMGGDTPKEQLIREQIEVFKRRVRLLENKIAAEEESLLPRAEIHELLTQLAKVLRSAGERLHKQFGPQAASILDIAISDYENALLQLAPPAQLGPKSDEARPDLGDAAPAND